MQDGEGVIQIIPSEGWQTIFKAGNGQTFTFAPIPAFGLTNMGRMVALIPNWEGRKDGEIGKVTGFVCADEQEGYIGVGYDRDREMIDDLVERKVAKAFVQLTEALKALPVEPEKPAADPSFLRPGETL